MKKILIATMILIVFIFLLVGVVKGKVENGYLLYQNSTDTTAGSPFEASNSNSRYALIESIVNTHSFFFTDSQARLASPDLVFYKGKYFSVFTPGVSFIALPFYLLGNFFNLPQLLTFLLNFLVALVNLYLVSRLASKFDLNALGSRLCGFLFVFGTNALVYSLSLTQHHLSAMFLLMGLDNSLRDRTLLTNFVFGVLLGAAILVDIPNAFLFLPLALYVLSRHFLYLQKPKYYQFSVRLTFISIIIALLPFFGLLGWYNFQTTGSPFLLGQNIGRTEYPPHVQTKPVVKNDSKSTKIGLALNPRYFIRGLGVLVTSTERSWWYYSPVLFISFLGLFAIRQFGDQKQKTQSMLAFSVILMTYVVYAMFGDPWGGWSFGGRYLIPAAAFAAILLAPALRYYAKKPLFIVIFITLAFYSLYVSSLGAHTTSLVPPKIEVDSMTNPMPYTYQLNLNMLNKNQSSSLIYNWIFNSHFSAITYFHIYTAILWLVFSLHFLPLIYTSKKPNVYT